MRYARNMKALTPEENQKLKDSRVCIAGCGALGEYVFEMLGRIGVANLTIIDFDTFNTSNLNRQIYATVENLGCSKVEEAKKRMAQVNPDIKVNAIQSRISSDNALSLLRGHQVVVDALDNPASKIILQEKAAELQIPLVHGAISGWLGELLCQSL
jgi:molybdopterin/thiamine biosynthesis adenylyltransferase